MNTDPAPADTKIACDPMPCVNGDPGAASTGQVDGAGGATKPTPCEGNNCEDGATKPTPCSAVTCVDGATKPTPCGTVNCVDGSPAKAP